MRADRHGPTFLIQMPTSAHTAAHTHNAQAHTRLCAVTLECTRLRAYPATHARTGTHMPAHATHR